MNNINGRQLAYEVLLKVEKEGAYANLALDEILVKSKVSSVEKGFATELAYGALRHRRRLDYVLNQYLKKPINKLEVEARQILRLGLYQIMFLDRIPPSAAVNEAVNMAKIQLNRGVAGLVNGVLRSIIRKEKEIKYPSIEKSPLDHISIVYSHPQWMVKRWITRYGIENTINLCVYNNTPSELWLRTNTLKITRDELMENLASQGINVEKSLKIPEGIKAKGAKSLGQLDAFKKGFFTVQDESSMIVAYVVDPQPGALVLDVCSGPGGKTSHLAQFMKNKGTIKAFDIHNHRLRLIDETCTRLGITIVKTDLQDARYLNEIQGIQADYILVDAPCSGLGVLSSRADAKWHKNEAQIDELALIQGEILASVEKHLKPGGRLVYSTCTIEPEENFQVIKDFKKQYPHMISEDLNNLLPFKLERDEDKHQAKKGYVQLLPFIHNMDGFFIAVLRKDC